MWVHLGRGDLLILTAEHGLCVGVETGPGLLWGGEAGLGTTLQCVTDCRGHAGETCEPMGSDMLQPITGQHYPGSRAAADEKRGVAYRVFGLFRSSWSRVSVNQ